MLDPGIYSGMGVADAMAGMLGFGQLATKVIIVMLILSLLLTVSMAMAGSARTPTRDRSTVGCPATSAA